MQQPEKTALTSHPPHLQRAWQKSHQVALVSTNTEEASLWERKGRQAGERHGQCSVSRQAALLFSSLQKLAVPVNDVIGLLSANDAQCIDCCICGCKVWVLARAPSKAAFWALTQLQETAHTNTQPKGKTKSEGIHFKHQISPESMLSKCSSSHKRKKQNFSLHQLNIRILKIVNPCKGPSSLLCYHQYCIFSWVFNLSICLVMKQGT